MAKHQIIQIGEEQVTLTEKEILFCEAYLADANRNATQAALSAGYSKKTARNIANQNLAKLHIQKYLDFKTKPLLEKYGVTQERVIQELVKIGFSDMTGYFNNDFSIKPFNELNNHQRGALSQIKVKKEQSENGGEDVTVELKTWSKDKALPLLAEMVGLINRKGEIVNQTNIQNNNYFQGANNHIKGQ